MLQKQEYKTVYIRALSATEVEDFGLGIICVGRTRVLPSYQKGPLCRKDNTLIIVSKGRGFAQTRLGQEEMGPGDVFGQLQEETFCWWTDPDDTLEQYWVTVEGPVAANYLRAIGFGDEAYVLHRPTIPPLEIYLLEQLMATLSTRHTGVPWRATSLFLEICQSIDTSAKRTCSSPGSRKASAPELAKALIDAQYTQLSSIATVAEHAGVTPEYLATAFRARYGCSPQAYLTNLRLARAKSLLLKGASVKEVCYSVGYRDPNYFSTLFRRKEGIVPSSLLGSKHVGGQRRGQV